MPDNLHNLFRELIFRRRLFFMTALGVFIALGALVLQLPRGYKAEVWLLLDSAPIATALAPGSVSVRPAAELEIAERQLLSSSVLIEVAARVGIDPNLPAADQVAAIQNAVETRRLIGGNRASLLHVTFTHEDAQIARDTADLLSKKVLAGAADRQFDRAQKAIRMAGQSLQRSVTTLEQLDAEILTLRDRAGDAMPGTLHALLSQRADLQAQQRQLAKERVGLEARSTNAGRKEAERVDLQLERALQERDRAKSIYPEGARKLDLLDTRIAGLRLRLGALTASTDDTGAHTAGIALLRQQESEIRRSLKEIESAIQATPANAVTLESLLRQRAQAENQFEHAQSTLDAAKAWQDALRLGVANNWSVTDVPMTPRHPEGPRRLVLLAIVFALSLGSAIGLVALQSHFDPSIRSARQLEEVFGSPPLLELPELAPA